MLRARVIPCLLIHEDGLTKTVAFKSGKYIGDPLNAVKIFNEKEVDELMVLDIDKTVNQEPPDFNLIQSLANECRMPLCYGGGVKTADEAARIVGMGVEKIALSSAAVENLSLCDEIAAIIGKQSVVVVLDVKRNSWTRVYDVYTDNGRKKCPLNLEELLEKIAEHQVGEVVLNSIDRDGTMAGYDIRLGDLAKSKLKIPFTLLGGASSYADIKNLIQRYKHIGAAAGSLFVFKGRLKAVLINYPDRIEREALEPR